MTTIAYRDNVVAYDGLITCDGIVVYNDYNKCITVDNTSFFLCGAISDYDEIIGHWFSKEKIKKELPASGFVFDGDCLFEFGYANGSMWRHIINRHQYAAIGSGYKFALSAMDFGLSAEEAVTKASERCIYTGGLVRSFLLPLP